MEMQTNSEVIVVFPTMEDDPEMIFFGKQDEGKDEDDLSYWEFINSCDSDDADDVISLSDASWHPSLCSSPKDIPIPDLILGYDDDHHHQLQQQLDYEPFLDGYGEPYIGDQEVDDGYDYEDEDDDDRYDLDDELVPRALSGKLGRQRMRKLGKRAFAKMHTSKKSPFLFVKPGCVHGKHGLGLKHSF